MDAFDQLEHQLGQCVARRAAQTLRARRRRGVLRAARLPAWVGRIRPGDAVPVFAIAVTIAVVVAALALLHHGAAPGSGGPPPANSGPLLPAHLSHRQAKEIIYLDKAYSSTIRADQACAGANPLVGRYTISHSSPGPRLLSVLGVLRRPATAADKLPARVTYHPYHIAPNGSLPPLKGISLRYVRRARWRFGAGYYLVPAANANARRPLPERCYREQRAALRHELPHIPRSLRAGTLALEPRFINQLRQAGKPYEGVCLLALNDQGNGDGCLGGYSVAAIEQGQALSSGGPTGVGVIYGLVPDGVATVTLFYYGHTRPITAKAIDNVFIVRNPRQRLPNDGFPAKTVWRSATGAVIKTIQRPVPVSEGRTHTRSAHGH